MVITVPARKFEKEWRAALIVDNEFKDAMREESLGSLVAMAIGPVLGSDYAEGDEVVVTVNIKRKV